MNGSLRTDYWHPIGDMEGFLRAQVSFYGDSNNVVLNAYDDVDAYQVVNVFAGIRSAEGTWEVSAYAKNLFDEDVYVGRSTRQSTESYRSTATGQTPTLDSDYRSASIIREREIGMTLRYRFGGG